METQSKGKWKEWVYAFFLIRSKMIKLLIGIMTVISAMALPLTFASCHEDDNEMNTIFGSYSGTVTVNITDKSSNSVNVYSTEARLTLKEQNGKMYYGIVSTGDKSFETESSSLPLLNVNGNKNYHYSFKSDDGKMQVIIDSPDYNNIMVEDHMEDDDYIYQISFVGKRI